MKGYESDSELEDRRREEPADLKSSFGDVELSVTVELGRVDVTIARLLKLREGSVLEIPKDASAGFDLTVNGNKVGRGEPVVVNDKYGIRVTSVSDPEL